MFKIIFVACLLLCDGFFVDGGKYWYPVYCGGNGGTPYSYYIKNNFDQLNMMFQGRPKGTIYFFI